MDTIQKQFEIRSKGFVGFLSAVAIFHVIVNLLSLVSIFLFENDHLFGLIPLFDLNAEKNIPTLFATLLLLLNAILLFVLWRMNKSSPGSGKPWFLLSMIFGFLSLDEFASLHERLSRPVREFFNTTDIILGAWVIPYGIAVLLLSFYVLPRLRNLGATIRFWLFMAAGTYLFGAIGLETIGGRHIQKTGGQADLLYRAISLMEETMEMAGLIMLAFALLSAIRSYGGFVIAVEASSDAGVER